jgi:hypothetical protein
VGGSTPPAFDDIKDRFKVLVANQQLQQHIQQLREIAKIEITTQLAVGPSPIAYPGELRVSLSKEGAIYAGNSLSLNDRSRYELPLPF